MRRCTRVVCQWEESLRVGVIGRDSAKLKMVVRMARMARTSVIMTVASLTKNGNPMPKSWMKQLQDSETGRLEAQRSFDSRKSGGLIAQRLATPSIAATTAERRSVSVLSVGIIVINRA